MQERQKGLRSARQCRAQNQEHQGEEHLERPGELEPRVRQVLCLDAWAAGQHQTVGLPARQGASESELRAAVPIRVVPWRALASVAARQQVRPARREPAPERQAWQRDEPAPAPEQWVWQQGEQQVSPHPEEPELPD